VLLLRNKDQEYNNLLASFAICLCSRAIASRGAIGARSSLLKSGPPYSCLPPRLLHKSKIVIWKSAPSCDFCPPYCETPAAGLLYRQRTWANCALALSVSGASQSQLCPDGPHVHSSGPVYMPSCIHPVVRFALDQRVLCSNCCQKM